MRTKYIIVKITKAQNKDAVKSVGGGAGERAQQERAHTASPGAFKAVLCFISNTQVRSWARETDRLQFGNIVFVSY